MRRLLPATLHRVDTATGWKVAFPWRELSGPLRQKIYTHLGLGITALLGCLAIVAWALFEKPPDDRRGLFGLALMAFFFSVYLFAVGLNHIWTRSVVEVTSDGLRLIEQQGLVRRVRNRPWLRIRKLVTHHIVHHEEQRYGPPTETGALEVVGHGAQTLWFAHDYPRDWLLAVGAELAIAGKIPHEVAPWTTKEMAKVQAFFQHECRDEDTVDVDVPPRDCLCRIEQREGVLTLAVPVPPFRQTPEGRSLLVLLLVTLGFVAFATYAVWHEGAGVLNTILPIAIFFLAGGAILVAMAGNLTRWTLFRVDDERLVVVERPRFGKERERVLLRRIVTAVRAEEVDPNDNDSTAMHLKIVQAEGPAVTCLLGRRPEELWWIATVLRRSLGVPAVAGHKIPTDSAPPATPVHEQDSAVPS